jgi:hypothetical protein
MMACPRHPLAAAHAGHCAACLIEGAFFEPDAGGRAFVLSGFRRGTPIVGQVRTGRLDAGRAAGFLRVLVASAGQAHAAGLVHGAIGPGNVMSDGRSAFLLDFGLRAIVLPPDAGPSSASGDLEGFAALERSVRDGDSAGGGISVL